MHHYIHINIPYCFKFSLAFTFKLNNTLINVTPDIARLEIPLFDQ